LKKEAKTFIPGAMDDHPTEHQPAVAARKAREAAALKENLRRRKAQARAREDHAPQTEADPPKTS